MSKWVFLNDNAFSNGVDFCVWFDWQCTHAQSYMYIFSMEVIKAAIATHHTLSHWRSSKELYCAAKVDVQSLSSFLKAMNFLFRCHHHHRHHRIGMDSLSIVSCIVLRVLWPIWRLTWFCLWLISNDNTHTHNEAHFTANLKCHTLTSHILCRFADINATKRVNEECTAPFYGIDLIIIEEALEWVMIIRSLWPKFTA